MRSGESVATVTATTAQPARNCERVHTARGGGARTVRVDVLTPPGALNREAQKRLVAEVTGIVAKFASDPGQAARTWVLLSEAAEGGWGIAGTAFGREEFAAALRGRKQP